MLARRTLMADMCDPHTHGTDCWQPHTYTQVMHAVCLCIGTQ